MRRIIFVIILPLIFFGCKSDKEVKFCEGISPDGREINCGTTFSTGDLVIIVKSKESFGRDKIIINLFEKKNYMNNKIKSLTIDVKPDDKTASCDVKLYEEGAYIVEIIGKDDLKIADGAVEIIDVY